MEPGTGWVAEPRGKAEGIPLPPPVREVTLNVEREGDGGGCLLIVSSDDPLIWCDDGFPAPQEAEQAASDWYGVRSDDWKRA